MAKIEQSIEVNVPVRTAYDQLTRFEEYPRFIENVAEVRQIDDRHLHWHTRTGNLDMEWDAEITQQVPEQCIAWRNTSGPAYEGRIELQKTGDDRTTLKVTMECEPKQQMLATHGDAQQMIAQRAEHDLIRFKKFIETVAGGIGKQRSRLSDAQGQAQSESQAQQQPQPQPPQQAQRPAVARPQLQARPYLDPFRTWDMPMKMLLRASEQMDKVMAGFLGTADNQAGGWMPAIEIAQREDRFTLTAELPGVPRQNIHIDIGADRVTIAGERQRPPAAQAQNGLQRSERAYGRFCRVIALPPGADTDAATASLNDGVLEVSVPLSRQRQQGRRLEVR